MGDFKHIGEAVLGLQFPDDNTQWTVCNTCRGEYKPEHVIQGECMNCQLTRRLSEAEHLAREQQIVALLGGRWAYNEATFEGFNRTDGNQEAVGAIVCFNRQLDNLYLWGCVGCGKTRLATIAVRQAFEAGAIVQVIQTNKVVRSVRNRGAEAEQLAINELIDADVLLIDDIGVDKGSEFALQICYEIINGRIQKGNNGLLITSNLGLDEIAAKFGDDRLASRTAGLCKVIEIQDRDRRLK